jgi:hypothetical protein
LPLPCCHCRAASSLPSPLPCCCCQVNATQPPLHCHSPPCHPYHPLPCCSHRCSIAAASLPLPLCQCLFAAASLLMPLCHCRRLCFAVAAALLPSPLPSPSPRCCLFPIAAEILGDPYSKKSPLPSIGKFPSVCHPTYSRLPTTWPTLTSAATHYTQQPP